MLEWPVLLVTGMLVPLSLLPTWAHPFAWVLAPTWGVQAIREAALGGTPWPDIGMTLLLGGIYLTLGAIFLRHFEVRARRAATLSLT
jgi:ABC-2 type transport system permease protein